MRLFIANYLIGTLFHYSMMLCSVLLLRWLGCIYSHLLVRALLTQFLLRLLSALLKPPLLMLLSPFLLDPFHFADSVSDKSIWRLTIRSFSNGNSNIHRIILLCGLLMFPLHSWYYCQDPGSRFFWGSYFSSCLAYRVITCHAVCHAL